VPATDGDDLFVVATGNITINANIDTTGGPGDDSHKGRVIINAGAQSVTDNGEPAIDGMQPCSDCFEDINNIAWVSSDPPQKTATVNGNISAQDLGIQAGDIVVTGTVDIVRVNDPTGGSAGFFGTNSIEVQGDISADNGSGTPGDVFASGAANITLQNITLGSLAVFSEGAGSVQVGNVPDAVFITLSANGVEAFDNLPNCGETLVPRMSLNKLRKGGRRLQLLNTDPASLTAGDLKATNNIELFATGTISAGTVEVDENPNAASHEARIYANIGSQTAGPLSIGGGDIGSVTVRGNGILGTGAIMIGNPGGISVSDGGINSVKTSDGRPSIILDADEGDVTLEGDLIVNGDSNVRAGHVVINAGRLITSGESSIAAIDTTMDSTDPDPFIVIGASEFQMGGKLIVRCDSDEDTSIAIYPKNSVTISWNFTPAQFCVERPAVRILAGSAIAT